jgi:hypothetical protein
VARDGRSAAVRHECHRRSHGPNLPQPPTLTDAKDGGEHAGANPIVGELTVGELSPVNGWPLFYVYDGWGHTDHGAQLSAPLATVHRVHLAEARVLGVFLFILLQIL